MSEKILGYNPYSQESWEKIEKAWSFYREQIGLEGDILFNLIKEGNDSETISKKLSLYALKRAENIKAYHDLVEEINEKSSIIN